MTEELFTEGLMAALAEVTDDPIPAEFNLDSPLADIGLDSLGRVELLNILQENWEMDIDDDMLREMTTARDLFTTLQAAT